MPWSSVELCLLSLGALGQKQMCCIALALSVGMQLFWFCWSVGILSFIFLFVFCRSCCLLGLHTTVSIRIVADCGLHSCQVTRKLKRATTIEFTTAPAIIFINCWTKSAFADSCLKLRDSFYTRRLFITKISEYEKEIWFYYGWAGSCACSWVWKGCP